MLQEGPEIARGTDRVRVLPHAPLGPEAPLTSCRSTPNVHHPAHCVMVVLVISMLWSNSTLGESNDRIDELIATVVQMSKRINGLVKDVGQIKTDMKDIGTLWDAIHLLGNMWVVH